jgi:hypothetical protein
MDINLFTPPPRCVPDLDSSDNSLSTATEDSDNSFDPTPQSRHILFNPTAQYYNFSSDSYLIQSLPQNKLCNGRTWQGFHEIYSPIDQVVSNVTDASPKWEDTTDMPTYGHPVVGISQNGTKPGQSPYMFAYEEFSSERGIPDFGSMTEPGLSYSTLTTESSAVDSGYAGSEQTRRKPLRRREKHRWPCQLCDNSYFRQGNLRLHERKKHKTPSETARNVHQEAEAQDDRMAKSLQSTLGKVSPLPHSKGEFQDAMGECQPDATNSRSDNPWSPWHALGFHEVAEDQRMFVPQEESYGQPCPFQLRLESSFEAHPSRKDEAKLMNYQGYDTTDGSDDTRVSKKRENPDDDASRCSGAFSSEEGDDSDGGCDNITTWNCSQRDALPSFLPFVRGHDADTSSPCGDSPDSGSTTSGTKSDTPASSASGLTGGNSLQGNGDTSPKAGTGASNNSNNPILEIKDGLGVDCASDAQPLPLICWYSAAGIACTAKYVKMSTEVRHLWK